MKNQADARCDAREQGGDAVALGQMPDGGAELSADDLRELFLTVAWALTCDALRLKPRERQFALLLASDSFAGGAESGVIGVSAPVRGVPQTGHWCVRLSDWRPSEIWEMLQLWRRAGWLTVDEAEGSFRLAPDRLPGWADVIRLSGQTRARQPAVLGLDSGEGLNKEFAKISQAAAKVAKISQPLTTKNAKISQPLPDPIYVKTFNRLTSERINVKRSELAKISQPSGQVAALKRRVWAFVGQADWENPHFWNSGLGWREKLFTEEAAALEAALNYCEAGLKSGETTLRKTRGAMLWNQFQRERQREANA